MWAAEPWQEGEWSHSSRLGYSAPVSDSVESGLRSPPFAGATEGVLRPAEDDAANDVALMRRAAAGEVEAFAQIYDRHAAGVLALARRVLHGASDAQDLLHDVFLEAWRSVREYDASRASVRTWLLVRARSRALDRRARNERELAGRASLAEAGEASSDRSTLPQTERQIALREALATLTPTVRETLVLTYFEGLTASEVALRMNTLDGTVRSRLARGLEIMQRALSSLEERRHEP